MRVLVFIFLMISVFVSWAAAQPAETENNPKISEIYLAKDDGKGKAGDRANSFITTDIPIHCVVMLNSAETVAVKMNLVAVSVTGVKPQSKVVSTIYKTKPNQNRVNFSGKPEGRWAAGKYRAEIFVNDSPAGKLDFEISQPSSNASAIYSPKEASKKEPARKPL